MIDATRDRLNLNESRIAQLAPNEKYKNTFETEIGTNGRDGGREVQNFDSPKSVGRGSFR